MKTLLICFLLSAVLGTLAALTLLASPVLAIIYLMLTHEDYLRTSYANMGIDYDRWDDQDYWDGLNDDLFVAPVLKRKGVRYA